MPKEFDRYESTVKDIKNQPISVVETEIPALAKALGIDVKDLLHLGGLFETAEGGGGGIVECCRNDSW
jgi:hypothetical protein